MQSAHVARCLGIMLLDPAMRDLIPTEDLALELVPALRAVAEQCTARIQVPTGVSHLFHVFNLMAAMSLLDLELRN